MSTTSNNGNSLGLQRPLRLSLLWLLLQILVISALPPTTTTTTPPPPVSLDADDGLTKRTKPYPEFPSHYQGRVEKGRYLLDLMSVDNEGAARRNGGASVVSPFQDLEDLERWGWNRGLIRYKDLLPGSPEEPNFKHRLDIAFQDPDHPVLREEMILVFNLHLNKFMSKDGLQELVPTLGYYDNVAVPLSGAFIIDHAWGPRYKQKKHDYGTIPDLNHLSDIAFLQWVYACQHLGVSPTELKLMIVSHIMVKSTLEVLKKALQDKGLRNYPFWQYRAVLKTDTPEAAAILGATLGSAVAWMLIQHKDTLGVKKITEVHVWAHKRWSSIFSWWGCSFDADPDDCVVNIRFIIEDV